jgi:hypothetical protein
MTETRGTASSLDEPIETAGEEQAGRDGRTPKSPLIAAPAALVIVLLLLATVYQGAFDLRDWGPPALLVLGTLLALQLGGGGLPLGNWWVRLMVGGIWAFAGWALLSAVWSASPSAAWQGGARDLFYAALITAPIVLIPRGRVLEVLGLALAGGIAALAVYTLIRMLVDGSGMFLAGRLDDPVGYRNATALLFTLGFWPLVAIAARGPRRFLRGASFALAVLCLALAFLTQSRGIVVGLAAGGVVAIALGPERVRRAWLAVLALGLLALFSKGLLTPYDAFDGGQGIVEDSDIATAARMTLLLMLVAFAAGLAIALVDNGLRSGSAGMARARIAARVGLVAIVIVGIVGGLAAVGDPVSKARTKWDEFTANQTVAEGATRYGNVSGQRYDLWRVSLDEFKDHPIAGAGEAAYPFDYYQHRNTDRNLDDPHGLPFQVLGELGLVGALLFLAFLVGAAGALLSRWKHVPAGRRRIASGLAASGAVLIGQSFVDWMWRIPGVTGLGLLCLGLGVALTLDPMATGRRLNVSWRAATAAALAAAVVAVGVLYVSDFFVRQARARAADSPAGELSSARTASKLNPVSVVPWYLMASAHESLGELPAARKDLAKALDLEPDNFATMGVIGDFYARQGRYRLARRWYQRALALNPVDVGLQQLVKTGGRPPPP